MKIEEFDIIQNYPALHDNRLTFFLVENNIADSVPHLMALNKIYDIVDGHLDYSSPRNQPSGMRIFFACKNVSLDFHLAIDSNHGMFTFLHDKVYIHLNAEDITAISKLVAEHIEGRHRWT